MRELAMVLLLSGVTGAVVGQETAPVAEPATDCRDGLVADDGSVETGYGFVPNSKEGIFVQRFDPQRAAATVFKAVCVCWLKTRGDRNIEFEVVLFEDQGGGPAPKPSFAHGATATAEQVAPDVKSAGSFVRVPLPPVPLPAGPFYLGVRWNPHTASHLFVCADKTPRGDDDGGGAGTPGFFREDVRPRWSSLEAAKDPNMKGHQALMIRAVLGPAPPVPAPANASAPPVLKAPQ